jgi:hypothetical protein
MDLSVFIIRLERIEKRRPSIRPLLEGLGTPALIESGFRAARLGSLENMVAAVTIRTGSHFKRWKWRREAGKCRLKWSMRRKCRPRPEWLEDRSLLSAITEYPIPHSSYDALSSNLEGITAGPDGNVWFTDGQNGTIDSVTPDGTIDTYRLPRVPNQTRPPRPAQANRLQFGSKTLLIVNRRVAPAGARIKLTATVRIVGRVKGIPSGIVTFTDGTKLLGSARLRHVKAELATSALLIGSNSILASYSGNTYLTGSKSAVRIESISEVKSLGDSTSL